MWHLILYYIREYEMILKIPTRSFMIKYLIQFILESWINCSEKKYTKKMSLTSLNVQSLQSDFYSQNEIRCRFELKEKLHQKEKKSQSSSNFKL